MELDEYLNTFKKGSRKNRKIISNTKHGFNFKKMAQTKTFARITDSSVWTNERLKHKHLAWTKNFLPNRMRTFLFKFYNNLLGTRNRVAHIVTDFDPVALFAQPGCFRSCPLKHFLMSFCTAHL